MIVLEGPDNAGKSTLGDQLSRALMSELVHTSKPGRSLEEMQEIMSDILLNQTPDIIYDRVPIISEQIYGPIIRNENKFAGEVGNRTMELFLGREPLIIYCRREPEELVKIPLEQKEHDTPEHIEKVTARILTIAQAYDDFFDGLRERKYKKLVVYDWTKHNFETTVKSRAIRHIVTFGE